MSVLQPAHTLPASSLILYLPPPHHHPIWPKVTPEASTLRALKQLGRPAGIYVSSIWTSVPTSASKGAGEFLLEKRDRKIQVRRGAHTEGGGIEKFNIYIHYAYMDFQAKARVSTRKSVRYSDTR